jgi:hypothetical protein
MGFDMHNIAPEEERWDQFGPVLPSWISHSSFRARRKHNVIKRAATAPKTAPGKNPAAIAPAGKEGQDVDTAAQVVEFEDFSDEGDGTGVMVAWGFAELVAVVDDDAVLVEELDTDAVAVVEVFSFREQVLSPWQV